MVPPSSPGPVGRRQPGSGRGFGRRRAWAALTVLLGLATGPAGAAESFSVPRLWTPSPEGLAATLKERPALALAPAAGGGDDGLAGIGAVLFRSPYVLGPVARRMGLSCDACHGQGAANGVFFLSGLSARPGTVDLTSAAFEAGAENGVFDPLAIPSLRGAARTAPYGHGGQFPTVRAFVRHVIVDEFAGEPSAAVIDALDAYVARLGFLPNRLLDPSGRLTAGASAAARRGEALFMRPFPGNADQSCAGCHPPARDFTNRQRHDVGTGGAFDTPSLRDSAAATALFHDGRAGSLDETADHFDRFYALDLGAGGRADLVAYLRAIGSADRPVEPVTLAGDLERHDRGLEALETALGRRDGALADLIAATLRLDLGAMAERFDNAFEHRLARAVLAGWSRRLEAVGDAAAAGRFDEAEAALARYRALRPEGGAVLAAAAPTSLYDPARLDRFLAERAGR